MHKGVGGSAIGVLGTADDLGFDPVKIGSSLTTKRSTENAAQNLDGLGAQLKNKGSGRNHKGSLTPRLLLRKSDGSVWGQEKSFSYEFGHQLGSDPGEYFT
jgi:hypothetical protein